MPLKLAARQDHNPLKIASIDNQLYRKPLHLNTNPTSLVKNSLK